jgi:hypothetical protein
MIGLETDAYSYKLEVRMIQPDGVLPRHNDRRINAERMWREGRRQRIE